MKIFIKFKNELLFTQTCRFSWRVKIFYQLTNIRIFHQRYSPSILAKITEGVSVPLVKDPDCRKKEGDSFLTSLPPAHPIVFFHYPIIHYPGGYSVPQWRILGREAYYVGVLLHLHNIEIKNYLSYPLYNAYPLLLYDCKKVAYEATFCLYLEKNGEKASWKWKKYREALPKYRDSLLLIIGNYFFFSVCYQFWVSLNAICSQAFPPKSHEKSRHSRSSAFGAIPPNSNAFLSQF